VLLVFGGFRVAHPFSFLCCWFLVGSVFLILLVFCVVFLVGSVLLILFVFYVVVFGGFRVAHPFSFLCCGFWWVPCCSSF
jgi:hypothetical protein